MSLQQPTHLPHIGDVLTAFQMLHDMSPYMKFGHFAAKQDILEAAVVARKLADDQHRDLPW